MNSHTTNYYNTFIGIADDSVTAKGEIPPLKGDKKTVATLQFEIIHKNPYQFTSDEVLFQVFAERNELTDGEMDEARKYMGGAFILMRRGRLPYMVLTQKNISYF